MIIYFTSTHRTPTVQIIVEFKLLKIATENKNLRFNETSQKYRHCIIFVDTRFLLTIQNNFTHYFVT